MRDFFMVLLGAICSTLGGIAVTLLQAKKARQIRRDELVGEQSLEVAKKALSLTDQLHAMRMQCVTDDIIKLLDSEGEWFSTNQILLPHAFVENWRTLRVRLRQLKRREQHVDKMDSGPDRDKWDNEIDAMEQFVDSLIDEMEGCLRKELGLKEVNIKKFNQGDFEN
jgi:hypothetical protein